MEMPALIVKVISATLLARVVEPEASIIWGPDAAVGMAKVMLQPPCELAGMLGPTGEPSKVTIILVSLLAKPTPVTVTEVPEAPLARLTEMAGLTVKVICARILGI
jgi:hypothetical protein